MEANPFDQFDAPQANPFDQFDASPQPESNALTRLQHYEGLGKRAVVKGAITGAVGLPALGMDAYDALVNGVRWGMNQIPGSTQQPYIDPFKYAKAASQVGDLAADKLGLPSPQNKVEAGLSDVGSAGISALSGAGIAGLANSAAPATSAVSGPLESLASAPGWQAAGAAAGAGATNVAREMGVKNQGALLGIGMIGSLAPGSIETALERGAVGAKSLAVDPFTDQGRELIAGSLLNRLATNPELAADRMAASGSIVPGSNPTIAQVSRDPGLIIAERPMVNAAGAGGALAERLSQQNAARQSYLNNITMPSVPVPEGVTPARGTLEYAQAKQARTIDQAMRPAFQAGQAGSAAYEAQPLLEGNYGPGFADTQPALQTIDNILGTSKGARKDVQDAMSFAKERLTQPTVDLTDPETLYSVRKDLNDAKNGKYDSEKPSLRLAKGELSQVINAVDGAIDQAAPGYLKYMDLYRQRSSPLNQQEAISALRSGGVQAVKDPLTNLPILTPGKFNVAFQKAVASGALGPGAGNGNLSTQQMLVLQRVADDLDRGSAVTAGTMKTPGSDTFRNFTVANLLGRVVGKNFPDTATGKGLQTLAKPIQWMYTLPDEAVSNLLVNAALDPKLAARMMRTANQSEMQNIGEELAKRAASQGLGAARNENIQP